MESANALPEELTFEINPVRRPDFLMRSSAGTTSSNKASLYLWDRTLCQTGGSGFQVDRVSCALEHQLFEPSEEMRLFSGTHVSNRRSRVLA